MRKLELSSRWEQTQTDRFKQFQNGNYNQIDQDVVTMIGIRRNSKARPSRILDCKNMLHLLRHMISKKRGFEEGVT